MVTVVYCTRESNPKHKEHIIKSSGLLKNIEVIEIINKGEALTKAYNRGLKQATNDIVVFMHDDIEFDNGSWGNKLIKHFNDNAEFGILGLAGTTDMDASGRWWTDRSKMVGIVNHEKDGKKWESRYSKSWVNQLNEVIIVDGLFFAVHKKRIKENFDEKFDGFHFYEVDFVFSNFLKGVKVGVMYNIRVTHKSIGETNEEWEKNRLQFVEKFNQSLPAKHVPDFYSAPINPIVGKTPIKVIIQSSGDVNTFKRLYENIMSFKHNNVQIILITNDTTYNEFKDLSCDNIKVYEGFYDSLPKNLSVLKFEDDFLSKNDEIIFFMNDNIVIFNDIFSNFVKLYSQNKKGFGCGFPLSYNENKTIFCSRLDIYLNKDGQVAIDMKDTNTYYNVCNGHTTSSIGNLSDCFVTTAQNLKTLDWFKVNYETPLYFNEFSLRLFLQNKITYNDTNSLTTQHSFGGQTSIQQDFQNFVNFIGSDEKLKALTKKIS
jgi:hypothetical protein